MPADQLHPGLGLTGAAEREEFSLRIPRAFSVRTHTGKTFIKWCRFPATPRLLFYKSFSLVTPVLDRVGSSPSSPLLHTFGPPSTDLWAEMPASQELAGLIIKLTKLINHNRLIRVTRWERWHSPNSPIGYECAYFFFNPHSNLFPVKQSFSKNVPKCSQG